MIPRHCASIAAGVFLLNPLLNLAAEPGDNPEAWARWRGPLASGVAPAGKPVTTWSESENVKWKLKIPGFGTSTPIIWGDNVFVVTAVRSEKGSQNPPVAAASPEAQGAGEAGGRRRGGGRMRSETPSDSFQFTLLCVDRNTGKIRWQKVAREQVPHEGHHRDHGFASASPVTDGKHVYAYFGSRGLFCFDFEGNLKWEKDFGDMQTRNGFGEGTSPALHGDTLVVTWDHEEDDFVVALDKNTGKELWRKTRDEPTSWATPLVVEHGGKAQAIINATNRIRSYDLATGDVIWEAGGMTTNVIPSPIVGHGMVYLLSGFRGAALLAIKLGAQGDVTNTDAVAWKLDRGTPYVPSGLLSEDRLYFFSGNKGTLSCVDALTGKPHYEQQRIDDLLGGVYASPIAANGHVYLVGRDGKTVVIKDSGKLEVVATNKLDDKFDASGAIVGNELFLRGHEHLYCIAPK